MFKILKEITKNHPMAQIIFTKSFHTDLVDVELRFRPNVVFHVYVENAADLRKEYKKILKELDLIFD